MRAIALLIWRVIEIVAIAHDFYLFPLRFISAEPSGDLLAAGATAIAALGIVDCQLNFLRLISGVLHSATAGSHLG